MSQTHRLAAILAADVAGYSRLMGADEEGRYERLQAHLRELVNPKIAEAQAYFRRALAIDAQYPQATAAPAIALCNAGFLGWADNPAQNYEESFELAQRAVAPDPRYPIARYALGLVYMWTQRSERAVVEFQEAIKLNPSYAAAYVVLGQAYLYKRPAGGGKSPRRKKGFVSASAIRAYPSGCPHSPRLITV